MFQSPSAAYPDLSPFAAWLGADQGIRGLWQALGMALAGVRARRHRRESPQAREACLVYLRLGPGRSLAQAAAELGKSKSLIERWSSAYRWRARLLEWTRDPAGFESGFSGRRSVAVRAIGGPRAESPEAWEAWLCYREQGLSRSYGRVAAEVGKSKSLIARWGRKHEWGGRIERLSNTHADPYPDDTLLALDDLRRWLASSDGESSVQRELSQQKLAHASRLPKEDAMRGAGLRSNQSEGSRNRSTVSREGSQPSLEECMRQALESIYQPAVKSPAPVSARRSAADRVLALTQDVEQGQTSPWEAAEAALALIKRTVKAARTDEPLWRDEVNEHLDDLGQLLRDHTSPPTDGQSAAAAILATRIDNIALLLERRALRTPGALEDMFDTLATFFKAFIETPPLRQNSRPHLTALDDLLALLPGTRASRDR